MSLRHVAVTLIGAALASSSAAGANRSAAHLAELLPASVTQCVFPQASETEPARRSIYVAADDGVRLAVDIFTDGTSAPDAKRPTLFSATRYWRASQGATPSEVERRWIAAGYAVVNMDVRGTGASFGQWYIPYTQQEARDIGHVAQWIARQPWSDGHVVMTGTSYPGTTPLLAAAFGGSAIRAIAPKFSDFDAYTDLEWPGGIPAEGLLGEWGRFVRGLDMNEPVGSDSGSGGATSVRPVDGPDGASLLAAAVADHKRNAWSYERSPYEIVFKDEPSEHMHGLTIDDGGAYRLGARIERSNVPIFGWGSWLDSGIAQGMLNRFMTLKNPQLSIIGAWTHGARANANTFDPDGPLEPVRAAQDQWVHCYLDSRVRGRAAATPEHRLIYFTMGENRWKSTDVWPLPGTRQRRLYLDAGGALSERRPAEEAADAYRVDFDASTGAANRWATQAGAPRITYDDRAAADRRLLAYTSAPLRKAVAITGQPVVTLDVTSNQPDGNIIVYLEDVSPSGQVTYVTEGGLRAIHRKLSPTTAPYRTGYPYRTFAASDAEPLVPGQRATLVFQLQATSVRIAAGHAVRVAIAGADKGTFLRIPDEHSGEVMLEVARGGVAASFIDLPEVP